MCYESSSGTWPLTFGVFVLPLSWHDVFWADSVSASRLVYAFEATTMPPMQYAVIALQSLCLINLKFLLLFLFNLLCVYFRQRATCQGRAKQPRLPVPGSQTESHTWNCGEGDTDEEIYFVRCRQFSISFCLVIWQPAFQTLHQHYHHGKRWSDVDLTS